LSKKIKAHIALFAVALIYGANYTIAKDVMNNEYVQPSAFILMRACFAALTFSLLHFLFVKEKVEKRDFKRLLICGIIGVTANQLLFFEGLKLTSQINAALIMTTIPITVLVMSAIILKDKITRSKIFGIGLGIVGAILLITYGKNFAYNKSGILGDVLVFMNAACYGTYLVLVKSLMEKYHPITVVKWVFTFGAVFVIPFGFSNFLQIEWNTFPTYIWMAVFYVLIFTTVLTYLLNAFALKEVNTSVVSIYVYLQPLLATIIAVVLAKDILTVDKIGAGLLIFIGVYFVSRREKEG
jgi:drug/metabolite transporter (DMT)-like permease